MYLLSSIVRWVKQRVSPVRQPYEIIEERAEWLWEPEWKDHLYSRIEQIEKKYVLQGFKLDMNGGDPFVLWKVSKRPPKREEF